MRSLPVLLVAAILAVAVAVGATAGAGAKSSTQGPAQGRAACHPRGPGELINDRVYVLAKDGTRLRSGHYPGDLRVTKTPVFVKRDESAELSTDDGGPVRLVKWSTEKPAYVQSIDEMTGGDGAAIPTTDHCGDEWRFFAGGFVFRGRHCAVLHVVSGEVAGDLEYGLRASCN